MYTNMIFNHWLLMWELRAITETHLREISRTVLEGPIGRKFWRDVRELRISSAGTRRERRFNQIIDEEYRKAIRTPVTPVSRPPAAVPQRGSTPRTVLMGVLTVLGVALVVELIRKLAGATPPGGRRP